ncbi:hypothetical protein CW304_05210 [Bacillus sp. UFRGS-B20]|nr:hypothetical protein CW304_05210 [Bacillus sp. UFRGS-B20]
MTWLWNDIGRSEGKGVSITKWLFMGRGEREGRDSFIFLICIENDIINTFIIFSAVSMLRNRVG